MKRFPVINQFEFHTKIWKVAIKLEMTKLAFETLSLEVTQAKWLTQNFPLKEKCIGKNYLLFPFDQ